MTPRAPVAGFNRHSWDDTPWVIILAGGEGTRIRPFTTISSGVAVPKQFCRVRDERTMLAVTIDRALRLTPPGRVVVAVVDAHREWWAPELAHIPARNVLTQPESRGTAVAILAALTEIQARHPLARVVVMPSDFEVEDEEVLSRVIRSALLTSTGLGGQVVLLGVKPSHVDCEYGLIVPDSSRLGPSRGVREFVEKPPFGLAERLTERGALWNSMIFACEANALCQRIVEMLPSPARTVLQNISAARDVHAALQAIYRALPELDFCRHVLQRHTRRLRVVEVPPCGWTDLGTPVRLMSWLERHHEARYWRDHDLRRVRAGWPS